jgi:hypothetical protein
MFVITDTSGDGNLQIGLTAIQTYSGYDSISQTLHNLVEAFYYYSASQWYGNGRQAQISPGPIGDGTQTLKFVGFDQAGAVQTILATFPAGGIGSGGGGCPDPEVPIMLADHSTKPAGQIQVGDLLYTIHEHTLEFGIFPVTAIEIEEQPMVMITFTDGTTLNVSRSHKFLMASGQWQQVFELGQGSIVKGLEVDKTVDTIVVRGLAPAVKLTVADAHTYIADGLISHNVKAIIDETIVYT